MPSSRELERQILKTERLKIRLLNENGRLVRADSVGFPEYPYQRAANGNLTISAWKKARFFKHYEGYEIEVLGEDGEPVNGRTILENVRGVDVSLSNPAQFHFEKDEPRSVQSSPLSEIQCPELVLKPGGPFPSIEVDSDHLPDIGSFEDAIYSGVKAWVERKKLFCPATIWTLRLPSCNFIEHGMVRSVFVVPFGFGPKFLEFLHAHLCKQLKKVRFGDYACPNIDDGWQAVCHVQDGKVYQVGDVVTWFEVL